MGEILNYHIILNYLIIAVCFLLLYVLSQFIVKKIRTIKMRKLAKELNLSFTEKIIYRCKPTSLEDKLIHWQVPRNIIEGKYRDEHIMIADFWEAGNGGELFVFKSLNKYKLIYWRPTFINGKLYWDVDIDKIKEILQGNNDFKSFGKDLLMQDVGGVGVALYYKSILKNNNYDLDTVMDVIYGYFKTHNKIKQSLERSNGIIDFDDNISVSNVSKFLEKNNVVVKEEVIKKILVDYVDYFKNI